MVQVSGSCNRVTNFASLTVNTPTTADPLISQTNCAGDTVSFTTTAHGTRPFSYQWVKDGKALPAATTSSWVIANASVLASGTYSVRVSGLCNAVTNSATLTVNPPTMATALANQTQCFGQDATFSALGYSLRLPLSPDQLRWELATSGQRVLDAIAAASPRGLDGSLYGEAGLRSTHEAQHTGWIKRWRAERGS